MLFQWIAGWRRRSWDCELAPPVMAYLIFACALILFGRQLIPPVMAVKETMIFNVFSMDCGLALPVMGLWVGAAGHGLPNIYLCIHFGCTCRARILLLGCFAGIMLKV